jgi:DNA polymerase III epsilon subunit-like protein
MAIRVLDLETTSIDPTDHVVEVGSVDLLPGGSIMAAALAKFPRYEH